MRTFRRALLLCTVLIGIVSLPVRAAAQALTSFTVAAMNAGTGPVTGKICLNSVDLYANSISVSVPGLGFYLKDRPFCGALNAGALVGTLYVPNSATDSAHGHGYHVIVYDTTNNIQTDLGVIYGIQGTSWAIDTYAGSTTVPTSSAFTYTVNSSDPTGACTPPSLWSNSNTGDLWTCGTSGVWNKAVHAASTSTQAGSSYTLQPADCAPIPPTISFTNAGAVALTLPTTGLTTGCLARIKNLGGSASVITLTPATGTIDGNASLAITYPGDGEILWDGTTWKAFGGYGVRGAANLSTPFAGPYVLSKGVLSAVNGSGVLVYSTSAPPTYGTIPAAQLPLMVASGSSHAAGAVPDPGATAGTTRYLREDGTWVAPAGGGGTPGGTSGQLQWNNGGVFAGLTLSGDCTVTASTGIILCGKTSGTAFGALATATQPLAGTGAAVPTGPSTTVAGDLVVYSNTTGQQSDSFIPYYQNISWSNISTGLGAGVPTTGATTDGTKYGDRNTIVGVGAGTAITTARENVIIGAGALAAFTGQPNDNVDLDMVENGLNNAIGSYALNALLWTPWSPPVGGGTYQSQDNSAFGQKAGPALTGAESSDFFGNHNCTTCTQALNSNSMGAHTLNDNTGTGTQYVSSVSNLGSGNWNGVGNKLFLTGIGNLIAPLATTPTYDDVQGNGSLAACLDCAYNVVNGSLSGNGIVHGTKNVLSGYNIAPLIDLSSTTLGGYQTCLGCTSISAQQVTLWGWENFRNYTGSLSSVTTLGGNVAATASGTAMQGDVFIGDNTALNMTGTGGNNASYDTFVGSKNCQNCTTLYNSTFLGNGIASSGIALSGSNLNCFGRASCSGLTGSESNDIAIGLNSSFLAGTSGSMQFGTGTNSVANSVQFNSWGSITGLAGAGPLFQTAILAGTPTFTAGSNITSVVCASGYTCDNRRGELTIVAGSGASTGTIATVNFSATLASAPGGCMVTQNGGSAVYALGHGTPGTTGFTVTAGISVASATVTVDYRCEP